MFLQIDWFRGFAETVSTKSLSKAAANLNMSQTALSKQIKHLENSFEVSLFHRSSTGMEVTSEGQLLYEKVCKWLLDIQDTKRQLVNLSSVKRIVFGSLPAVSTYYLPERILRLKSCGVNTDIRVFHTSEEVFESFLTGQIDVAILEPNFSIPKIYWMTDLFKEKYYAVLPKSNNLTNHPYLELQEIVGESLVMYPGKCDVRKDVETAFALQDLSIQVTSEVPFGEAILGFVAAGAGITIVPEMIANHLANTNLVAIPVRDFGVERIICMVTHSKEQLQFLSKYLNPA